MELGDNIKIEVVGKSPGVLRKALEIAFSPSWEPSTEKDKWESTHYKIDDEKGFILYSMGPTASKRCEEKGITPFPFPMCVELAINTILDWLKQIKYPPEPGHDGSNAKGFRVYNDEWSRIEGEDMSFIAIKPEWIWYGK